MKKNEKKTMANKRNLQTNKEKTSVGLPLWATHGSPDKPLKIGNAEIPCYVLSNGHHPDYSESIGVIWLCPKHHAKAHRLTIE